MPKFLAFFHFLSPPQRTQYGPHPASSIPINRPTNPNNQPLYSDSCVRSARAKFNDARIKCVGSSGGVCVELCVASACCVLSCVHAITADGAQRCVRVVHQVAQALPRRNYRAWAILDTGSRVHGALLQGPCTRGANRSHRRARHGASIASQARLAEDDHIITGRRRAARARRVVWWWCTCAVAEGGGGEVGEGARSGLRRG